jgi:hypothetical protein
MIPGPNTPRPPVTPIKLSHTRLAVENIDTMPPTKSMMKALSALALSMVASANNVVINNG